MARLTPAPFPALALGALGVLTLSVLPAFAASEPASWPAKPAAAASEVQLYLLAFADQDIAQVAGQVLGVMLGTPFEIDPAVHGKMSLVVEERLTRDQLMDAFTASLARSGVTVVNRASGVKLVLLPRAAHAGAVPTFARRNAETVSTALMFGRADVKPALAKTPPVVRSADPWMLSTLILGSLALAAAALAAAALLARWSGVSVGTIRRPMSLEGPTARQAVLQYLCDSGAVTADAVNAARSLSEQTGRPVEQALYDMGAVSDEALATAYSAVTGLPVWRPDERPALVQGADDGLWRRGLVPVQSDERRLTLATSDPLDDECLAGVALETARTVVILVCSPADVRRAISAV